MQVKATGWWCENCEMFEDEDSEWNSDQCMGCGCDGADHTSVEVVTKGLS